MNSIEDYIARIDETCGEEKNFIVVLRHNRRNEALNKILNRAQIIKSIHSIIFELNFKGIRLRAYADGKLLVKDVEDKTTLTKILSELLK